MRRIPTAIAYVIVLLILVAVMLILAISTAHGQTPLFSQLDARKTSTTEVSLSWIQAGKSYICIYNEETLLSCDTYASGKNIVKFGVKGPIALDAHIDAGDILTLRDLSTQAVGKVKVKYIVYMPYINMKRNH